MSQPWSDAIHTRLHHEASEVKKRPLMALFQSEPTRQNDFTARAASLYLDYAKQPLRQDTKNTLVELAQIADVETKRDAMLSGDFINHTENRQVLHTALRSTQFIEQSHPDIAADINSTRARMLAFVDEVLSGARKGATGKQFTDVVSVGIGGSFFGPKMAEAALVNDAQSPLKVHYLANIDGTQIKHMLGDLNPETTLVIIASKSWTTAETQLNASAVKSWFLASLDESAMSKHWVALTAKPKLANEYGIVNDHIFPMWDFVGGRYSVWSTIGLPLALKIGVNAFNALLEGAKDMDRHFADAPLADNMPVMMALMGYFQQNYLGANNIMVLPYSHPLKALPAYLQQLDMESNGKSTDNQGYAITQSGPILWGAEGTNCQHSFMQLIHQGCQQAMIDFIIPAHGEPGFNDHHQFMVANCLGQAQALLQGKSFEEAKAELLAQGMSEEDADLLAKHKAMPGNRGSNTLVMDKVDAYNLGALLALYEHKVFVQGVLFNVNSFDQWGVELGKALGKTLMQAIETGNNDALDPSTASTLAVISQGFEK